MEKSLFCTSLFLVKRHHRALSLTSCALSSDELAHDLTNLISGLSVGYKSNGDSSFLLTRA